MKSYWKSLAARTALAIIIAVMILGPRAALAQEEPEETPEKTLTRREAKRQAKAQRAYQRGVEARSSGSYFLARRRLNNALKKDPSLYEAYKELGEVYLEQDRKPEAYNNFVKYLAASPDDVDVMLQAGIIGVEIGQGQRARMYLENGLEARPDNMEARMALARLNYSEGYKDAAKEILEKLVAAQPGRGEARLLLGKIYMEQGDRERAEAELTKAADLMPEDTEANYLLAKMAFDRGDFAKAITPLERIAGEHEPKAEAYYLLGICHLAGGDNESALENFERTLDHDRAYEQAGYQAGMLWKEKGELGKASDRFRDFAKRNPQDFESRYELGMIHLQKNETKKATKWFEEAAEIEPDNSKVVFALGKIEYDRGNYTAAYPYLRRALALDPDNNEIRYMLSSTYLNLPDFAAAERELEWILEREDDEKAKEMLSEIDQKKSGLSQGAAVSGEGVSEVKTVAVVNFRNEGSESGWDWLSGGLSEIVAQDLTMITSIEVVDTAAVDKFMREESLPPGSSSPAFKRMGAKAVLTGSYTVRGGNIKIDARLIETETTRVIASASRSGSTSQVFDVERELMAELISKYVPVTPAERDSMYGQPALGMSSLKDLARGKSLYYLGKAEQAEEYLQKVVDRNPDYGPAMADLRAVQDSISNAETLAIMTFNNATGNPEYDWMGRGISESLTTDLKKITGIYLVERSEIDTALEELKLGMLGFLDEETAPQVGKLVGAGVMLVGSYQVSNRKLRIDARMVDVETGAVLLTEKIQGYEDDIFKLEEQLAIRIADALNVSLTPEEMAALKEKPNIEKFKSYIISQSSFRVGEEGSAGADEEVIHTVAVSRFRNYTGDPKYDFLEEAISGYLVTELKNRAGMNMIERDQIDRALQEMQMSKTTYLDEKNAPRVGQLVGAEAVLVGFFQVQKSNIRIDARVIKTETGEVLKTVSVDGNVNDIFDIEDRLAVEIMSALGVDAGAGAGLAQEGGPGSGARAPLMAATYSFFLPGSSQYFISEKKTKGTVMLAADVLLILAAAAMSMQGDQAFNDYASSGDSASYNEGVDQIALRNMLVYGILGLGAYSAVDAYIEARKDQAPQAPPGEQPVVAEAQPTPSQ